MARKAICPLHGSYNAALPACPECRASAEGEATLLMGQPCPAGAAAPAETVVLARPTAIPPAAPAQALDETLIIGRQRRFDAAAPAAEELLGWLIVTHGPARGASLPISAGSRLGRKGGDVVVDAADADRQVAEIGVSGGHFVLRSLGWAVALAVNGQPLAGQQALNENDLIRIGDAEMMLKVLSPGAG
jgi:hypothetical protein